MLKTLLVDNNPIAQLVNGLFNKFQLLADLSDYLKKLLFNKDDVSLEKLLFLIGVLSITCKAGHFIYGNYQKWGWVPAYLQNQRKLTGAALKQKYGNCYVLVTGFTQGIGHGFAQILAQFGFNLLLISRNEQKVNRIGEQFRQRYKQVDIKYATTDLADDKTINSLQAFFKEFEHLDIGIIVNNAGSVAGGPYLQIKPEMLVEDIKVDLVALYAINRILLPKLRARGHRSAIINIASCTGVFLSPNVGVYSSSKRSVDVYSRILQLENRDRVDVISVRPFGVSTKMMKMKKGPFMITPRECAMGALAQTLSGSKITYGHYKHQMNSIAFHNLNEQQSFELYDFWWAQARAQAQ